MLNEKFLLKKSSQNIFLNAIQFSHSQKRNYEHTEGKNWLFLPPIFLFTFKDFSPRSMRSRRVCNRFKLNLDRNWGKCATEENLLCLPTRCSLETFPMLENSFRERIFIFQRESGNEVEAGKLRKMCLLIMNDNILIENYASIANSIWNIYLKLLSLKNEICVKRWKFNHDVKYTGW